MLYLVLIFINLSVGLFAAGHMVVDLIDQRLRSAIYNALLASANFFMVYLLIGQRWAAFIERIVQC